MKRGRNISSMVMLVVFLPAFLLQVWKIPVIYAWYYINQDSISKEFCVNKDKPELMCSGKCYINDVIEQYENSNEDWKSKALKSIEKNTFNLIKDVENWAIKVSTTSFNTLLIAYCFNYSRSVVNFVFHPPKDNS